MNELNCTILITPRQYQQRKKTYRIKINNDFKIIHEIEIDVKSPSKQYSLDFNKIVIENMSLNNNSIFL